MNINSKILSIPPYISTSWKNIASLHVQQGLVVTLHSGARIELPNFDANTMASIFNAYNHFMESESAPIISSLILDVPSTIPGFKTLTEHNPQQADIPDIPPEMLQKIIPILMSEAEEHPPKSEPHCNCVRCQIAKALEQSGPEEETADIVTEEDLRFRTWDIARASEQSEIYLVSDPLDGTECYQVALGEQIGCTCGKPHCEHVKAVLLSAT